VTTDLVKTFQRSFHSAFGRKVHKLASRSTDVGYRGHAMYRYHIVASFPLALFTRPVIQCKVYGAISPSCSTNTAKPTIDTMIDPGVRENNI
jgi:hypothetical protein